MKKVLFFNLLLILGLASCGGNKEIKYKTYTAKNYAYTVDIPANFWLEDNLINGSMMFERASDRSSDAALIIIEPVTNGFASFNDKLNTNPKFHFYVYKESNNYFKFRKLI